jgi:hypothetical protein
MAEMIVDVYCLERCSSVHGEIPYFEGEEVAGEDVATVSGETDIAYGGNDFGKEGFGDGIFFDFEYYGQLRCMGENVWRGDHIRLILACLLI